MRSIPVRTLVVASLVVGCGGKSKGPDGPPPNDQVEGDLVGTDEPYRSAPLDKGDPAGPPVAKAKPVTETFHGVSVADPYRWLEEESTDTKAWSDGQNDHARAILDKLPGLNVLGEEIRAYIAAPITRYGGFTPAGGKLFASRKLPDKEQRELVVMDAPEQAAEAKLVLDPAAGGDKTRYFDWFEPSPDGKLVALSISTGGSEAGSLYIVDLDGKTVEPVIDGVQRGTGGGDVAWTPDSKGIYYTRYPRAGEKPEQERDFWMQLWFHELGTPVEQDRYELGKDFPQIAEVRVDVDEKGTALVVVQKGDGGIYQHYVKEAKGKAAGTWRQISDWDDEVTNVAFGPAGDLWMVSTKGAPRGKLLRMPANGTLAKAKVVVKEAKESIIAEFGDQAAAVTKDRVFLAYQTGGPTTIRAFTHAGKAAKQPQLPDVSGNYIVPKPLGADMLVYSESFVVPGKWYRLATATGKVTAIDAVSPLPPVSLDDFEVHREMATSADGTQVPVNIVWKKGAPKDGSVPCLVTGYGGYGISLAPGFAGGGYPLLKRGVCFVLVNTRGGAEFGEAWHQAGMLTKKQNVFDDFAAAIDYLHAQKYTSPEKTVIMGGSNGGLLMGAMLTQHPEKMKAVVSQVGIYDMMRVELSPNGLYNTTEFGTVKDQGQFRALVGYSPYHRIVKGTKFPATLMTTGANDPRVSPWQSRKMVAAMQAAQGGDAPILLRTSNTSGHGQGMAMSERIGQTAHVDAFILWQLGISAK
ncbi:MAG TPA: alpha/beta fold hydrolase [Kofleriaceae bacterium]|nr:alpha/beta fold hydrolase [Kofleriaceae bacterium]